MSLSITIHLKLCLLLQTQSSQSITASLELTIFLVQVDYQKLAKLAGFKSAASASNSFFLVKKKINAGAMAKSSAAEKKIGEKAEGDEAGETNHDEGPTTPLTPSAKKRGRKAKAAPTSPEYADGGANGEENEDEPTVPTSSTPKKRARKPKAEPQSDEEAVTPKKRARKAAKPKAWEEAKVVTPHSGGDGDSTLPTPASPSPAKKRARKPSSAKRAGKSTETVEDASADEAEKEATAAITINKAHLADGDNQYTAVNFTPGVAQMIAGTSTVLAAEIAAAAANEYSKAGKGDIHVLVEGGDADNDAEEETTDAAGEDMTPA